MCVGELLILICNSCVLLFCNVLLILVNKYFVIFLIVGLIVLNLGKLFKNLFDNLFNVWCKFFLIL